MVVQVGQHGIGHLLRARADAPPGPYDLEPWLRFAVEECGGRIDRPVEFVQAYALGLPGGTAAAVERAIGSLVEQDVLLSSAFAAALGPELRGRLVSVGRYALRGVEQPQELFTLDPFWTG